MSRSKPLRSIGRDIRPEAKAQVSAGMSGVAGRARLLPGLESGGRVIDWSSLCLPRRILAHLQDVEVHDVRNANCFSTRSGGFAQHERFTLLVVLEGRGTMGIDSATFALEEGDALLIFPHQLQFVLTLPKKFSWLFLTFDLDDHDAARYGDLRDSPRRVSRKARRSLSHALEAYQGAADAVEALKASELLGEVVEELHQAEPASRETTDFGIAERVRRYIFERIKEEISLDEMSAALDLTPSALKDEYRRATGDSLAGFVRSARLVLAAKMLGEGNESPESVAARCGFKSFKNFSEAFEGLYRVSPAEFLSSAS